jgi:multidrug efflux pump subunit AcrA (membrane-fusion protein)
MGVDVLISASHREEMGNGFAIPFSAIAAGEGKLHHVWKVEEHGGVMTVRKVDVTVTGYLGDNCVVSGDLTEGDSIVAAGLSYLRDGDQVTPYTSPAHRTNVRNQP